MKAMILAAGRGQRMRPLTLTTPKPLLVVGGKPLIVYHLERLAAVGVREVIINTAYLGEQIKRALGSGSQWGLTLLYSEEPQPLETAGAIVHALPLLGDRPFILINADIWSDCDLSALLNHTLSPYLGHLLLTANPEHHPQGDFAIVDGELSSQLPHHQCYTFTGISVLSPDLIAAYPNKRATFPLAEVFHYAIDKHLLSAEIIDSHWCDIGTPERLQALDRRLMTRTD